MGLLGFWEWTGILLGVIMFFFEAADAALDEIIVGLDRVYSVLKWCNILLIQRALYIGYYVVPLIIGYFV